MEEEGEARGKIEEEGVEGETKEEGEARGSRTYKEKRRKGLIFKE